MKALTRMTEQYNQGPVSAVGAGRTVPPLRQPQMASLRKQQWNQEDSGEGAFQVKMQSHGRTWCVQEAWHSPGFQGFWVWGGESWREISFYCQGRNFFFGGFTLMLLVLLLAHSSSLPFPALTHSPSSSVRSGVSWWHQYVHSFALLYMTCSRTADLVYQHLYQGHTNLANKIQDLIAIF